MSELLKSASNPIRVIIPHPAFQPCKKTPIPSTSPQVDK